MASGTGSSRRWLDRQHRDPYVDRANREGWRSRAAFKLIEIDDREHLLRPGYTVVDLGAAPGGWSQVAARRVGAAGRVFALDRLPVDPIPGVDVLMADFLTDEGLAELRRALGGREVDLVLSDLAPNISGNRAIDQPRSMALVEGAVDFAEQVLRTGGSFLAKVFQGEGQAELERALRHHFGAVKRFKPKASRRESREIYVLASDYRMV